MAYRMHLEMGAKWGGFQKRWLGEERYRFRPRSQSVIANLRVSVRRTMQLQHGEYHVPGIAPCVSVLTTQIKVFAHCVSPLTVTRAT
jgi:hypothetical protein